MSPRQVRCEVLLFVALCIVCVWNNYQTRLTLKNFAADKLGRHEPFGIFHEDLDARKLSNPRSFAHVTLDSGRLENVSEGIPTTDVMVGLYVKSGSKFSEELTPFSRSKHASCYPRLFAQVPGQSGTSAVSACDVGVHHSVRNPVQHLFFLKTHKTGSQTLTNIFNRYALVHNLSVAVRKDLRTHAAQGKKNWVADMRPLPPGVLYYDMITDHVRFNETCVRHFLPNDSVFVSAVRQPLHRFVSAFYYYRDVWKYPGLTRIPGPDPISTYLSNMTHWDTPFNSPTHSQLTCDFGLDLNSLRDPGELETSIHSLSRTFHLVLLTEAFDESLVLLKRILAWNLQDMLYVKFNVGKTRRPHEFTQKQKDEFQKHRREEFAIYGHFRSEFYKKVDAEDDTFAEEVKVFKDMRVKVKSFCKKITTHPGKQELRVEGTKFSNRFSVCLEDCQLLIRESSSIRDTWFEELMINRLNHWSEAWQSAREKTQLIQ